MRFAILSDDYPSFRRPMAISLSKMFTSLGQESVIFYEGTEVLGRIEPSRPVDRMKSHIKTIINFAWREKYPSEYPSVRSLAVLKSKLRAFDAVFICAHMPSTLSKNSYQGVDSLKASLKILWATRVAWCDRVRFEPYFGGFSGFGRFDYYVVVSDISEHPIKKDIDWPVSVIGGDFSDAELYPEQTEFRALIDFERDDHIAERKIQVKTLEKLNIPYTVLSGTYSHRALYTIYRKHSVYFLAHRESFGLPIVELQHCGSYIFAPYKNWAPSHYINKSPYIRGEGELSRNFVVYFNDAKILEEKLLEIRGHYSPKAVLDEFATQNPDLHKGNLANLAEVIAKIRAGRDDPPHCMPPKSMCRRSSHLPRPAGGAALGIAFRRAAERPRGSEARDRAALRRPVPRPGDTRRGRAPARSRLPAGRQSRAGGPDRAFPPLPRAQASCEAVGRAPSAGRPGIWHRDGLANGFLGGGDH
jgi:hypothetical protein